ncbi:class I SAM-dependent rRNA methyltransferase [bacterium]|nr:class I SAM-dependent rRNA methyltransferase [bacterium]
MESVRLKPGKEKVIHQGHPWIFSGAILQKANVPPGTIVQVRSGDGSNMGVAFFNPKTNIALRMISRTTNVMPDEHFWHERLQRAIELRQWIIPGQTTAYRLIHAEADGFPGFIVDRYEDICVISITTAGIEKIRDILIKIIQELIRPAAIYEKSEGSSRKLEGLSARTGWIFNNSDKEEWTVRENGHLFIINPVHGQKTGFFIDQRNNRQLIGSLSQGKKVLNCFSYTGGFTVYCAKQGAQRTISIDSSKDANQMAIRNIRINNISEKDHSVIEANVFDFLRDDGERFDLIILDPPAFSKSRHDLEKAARGYKDINLHAMRKLNPGGLLATFSCSNFVHDELFLKIVQSAAADAGKQSQLLQTLGPGPDHPTLLPHIEGRYLKGLLLRILPG